MATVYQATNATPYLHNRASYYQVTSMTLTPGSGDYIASFTTSLESSSGNTYQYFCFYVNGVKVGHTERVFYNESSISNTAQTMQIYAYLSGVGAGEVVDVKAYSSSGSMYIYDRTLTLQEVVDSNISQATATTSTTTASTTYVLMNSMTITPGAAGDYIIYFSTSMKGPGNSRPTISVFVGGVQVAHSEREIFMEGSIPNTEFVPGMVIGANVGASDAVEIKWKSAGVGGTITAHERTLVVQSVDAYFQSTATSDTSTTSTSYTAMTSMTNTPGSADDYMVFFTTSIENSSGNYVMNAIMRDAGSQIAHTEAHVTSDSSCPNTAMPMATHAYRAGVGASDALDIYWKTQAGTATVHERTILITTGDKTSSDTTPPTPDPMTWVSEPEGVDVGSVTMTGTTATDVDSPPVLYFFDCVTNGSFTSSWQASSSYTPTGMLDNTAYAFRVKARDNQSNETAYSTTATGTTFTDTTPPNPDPMTWAVVPSGVDSNNVTMTASTATDADFGPTQYYFEETTGSGNDRTWGTSPTYTDTGLTAGETYTYRVKARDAASTPNETGWSSSENATTPYVVIVGPLTVAADSDDAEEASTVVDIGSSDLELGTTGGADHVGIRWSSVDVPPGVTILESYIQFTCDEAGSTSTSVTIYGEDAADPITFSEAVASDVSGRDKTTASVSWSSIPTWVTPGDKLAAQKTPSLNAVITEIIAHGSWAEENAMVFIFVGSSGRRTAEVWNTGSPELYIKYEVPQEEDTDPPTPDPMTWLNTPSGISAHSMAMTATTATDETSPPVTYLFTCDTDGSFSSSYQASPTYTGTGMLDNTAYVWRVKARDSQANETAYSTTATGTTWHDSTAPTPNPPTWSVEPNQSSDWVITMTANTVTDSETPPVQYYFEETTNNPGGDDSGWQSGTSFTDIVIPGTKYTYRVKTRDSAVVKNESSWSESVSVTTTASGTWNSLTVVDGDTAEEYLETNGFNNIGETSITSSDLEFCYDYNNGVDSVEQTVGLRWSNLPLISGTTIHSAYIQFSANEELGTTQTGIADLYFHGQAHDDAATFVNGINFNITNRTKTSSYINWQPDAWTVADERGTKQQTPDLATVIQEVIERPGWSANNSIVFIVTQSGSPIDENHVRVAWSGDPGGFNEAKGPQLYLDISVPEPEEVTPYIAAITPTDIANVEEFMGVNINNIASIDGIEVE